MLDYQIRNQVGVLWNTFWIGGVAGLTPVISKSPISSLLRVIH